MTEIIGVRFKKVGKVYYFSPGKKQYKLGQKVIVETARGIEMGEVCLENKQVEDSNLASPLKPVMRLATDFDFKKLDEIQTKKEDAMKICESKIKEHKIEMKLVDAEYTFDLNKVIFYFTAEGRVDFRDLVKDLASVLRTRIELRQIGVRDESKLLGGIGICGKAFCCATFLGEFIPVSIKMAKDQNLSLNPTKISGTCGRLMCCLKYEQDGYESLIKNTPKVGALVKTPSGNGNVLEANVLKGTLKVRLKDAPEVPKMFSVDDVKTIRDAVVKLDSPELSALKKLEE